MLEINRENKTIYWCYIIIAVKKMKYNILVNVIAAISIPNISLFIRPIPRIMSEIVNTIIESTQSEVKRGLTIEDVKTCTKVGECVLREDTKTKQLWKMNYIDNAEVNSLIKKDNGRIYLIVRKNDYNSEILKIGKSECKGGMKATFSFYQGGLGGSPSLRTFGIHHLIYNELKNNNKIEIYGIWSHPVKVMIPGLYGVSEELLCPSIHSMEDRCREDYHDTYGCYPPWNFQENRKSWPHDILEMYKNQVQERGVKRDADGEEKVKED